MTEPIFPNINVVEQKYGRVSMRDFGFETPGSAARDSLHDKVRAFIKNWNSENERFVREQLISAGWRPPESDVGIPASRPVCKKCGTHEVDLSMTCHNSACSDYAAAHVVYEGWKQPPAPPPVTTHKLNADQTVAVATDVYFNLDMSTAPRGVKLQLIGEGGVAVYGTYNGDPFWKEWCPVPKRRKAA